MPPGTKKNKYPRPCPFTYVYHSVGHSVNILPLPIVVIVDGIDVGNEAWDIY